MLVFLTHEAQKQYQRLKRSDQVKICRKLSVLQSEPYSGKKLSGEYKDLFSLKAWPYRLIYSINEKRKEVWIVSILHRQGAYK